MIDIELSLVPSVPFQEVNEDPELRQFMNTYKNAVTEDLAAMEIDNPNWLDVKMVPTQYLIQQEDAAGWLSISQ